MQVHSFFFVSLLLLFPDFAIYLPPYFFNFTVQKMGETIVITDIFSDPLGYSGIIVGVNFCEIKRVMNFSGNFQISCRYDCLVAQKFSPRCKVSQIYPYSLVGLCKSTIFRTEHTETIEKRSLAERNQISVNFSRRRDLCVNRLFMLLRSP